jgi:hypothetical protein
MEPIVLDANIISVSMKLGKSSTHESCGDVRFKCTNTTGIYPR